MAMDLSPETSLPLPEAAPRTGVAGAGFEQPEREAAFFYGLFLRGYSYQELRRDIEVPAAVQVQWEKSSARDPNFASVAGPMLAYRRRVLAIFQALVAAAATIQ